MAETKRVRKPKPRTDDLSPEERLRFAAYLDIKIAQAETAVSKAKESARYDPTPFSLKMIEHWQKISEALRWAKAGLNPAGAEHATSTTAGK